MNELQLHTTKKLKAGSHTETRTDGESFHFTFTAGNKVFTTAHFFGNKKAQDRALRGVVESMRDGVDVLVNK